MTSRARRPGAGPGTGWVRVVLPLAFGIACLWVLSGQMEQGAFDGLGPALSRIAPWQWAGALVATALSFAALGQYDVVLHRHLRTEIPTAHARLSGAVAIAIAQTLGMGIVSGALVRWRLLPGLSLGQATTLATGVAVTFLIGLSLVLGLAIWLTPQDSFGKMAPFILILIFISCSLYVFLHPNIRIGRITLRMPSLRALLAMAGLTFLDTGCAALALWCLMPDDVALSLAALLPVYMVALGAAILSGTPGGVGPFELVLVAALPQVADADLLCAIVAFRLVYYAVPAVVGAMFLIRPLPRARQTGAARRALQEKDLAQAPKAEAGLCRQSGADLLSHGRVGLAVIRPGQSLCMLFGPVSRAGAETDDIALTLLSAQARQECLIPLVYKADAILATRARQAGWQAVHVADDMVVAPAGFRTEGRGFRQLRRKLRQADQAGLTVTRGTTLPWGRLRAIDAEWQARQGTARGITMGRFCPEYLSHQAVFLARHKGMVVGFASFHTGRRDWCLDLMRTGASAPDGTMHALVTAAIAAARAQGVARLSLAAVPPERGPVAWLAERVGAPGLAQFKTSFGATRLPRYALAPSRFSLWLGLLDLWLAIRHPDRRAPPQNAPEHSAVQEDHEDYEFARARNV